jgi:hypothetical protein
MNMRGAVGKALFMDSERAAKYLAKGGRGSAKHIAKGVKAAEAVIAAGGTPAADLAHNVAIRSRQMNQGYKRAAVAAGGYMATKSRRGNSYNPPRTAQGSGRSA